MPTQSEKIAHGRYVISCARFGDHWQAQAFRNGRAVEGKEAASSKEGVIELIRQKLDARDARERDSIASDGAPSVDRYVEAFRAIGRLAEGHQAMLDAHLDAVEGKLSATQLAEAAGYQNWSAANLQYGILGCKLAEQLDWNPPKRSNGNEIWTASLASWDDETERSEENPHFVWIIRPQVVGAQKILRSGGAVTE